MKRLLLGTALTLGLAGMAAAEGYKIGISNTVQGNGWREEMVCAMKAEALASGKVESLNIAHRNTDAAGQLEDIRNLIQAGVQAIVVNPANADGVNAAIKEATDKGIVVVAVDQAVTEPSAYILSNNQEEYAYIGAKWLFETMGGKGAVVYMRGAAGAGADNDRDKGFKRAMAEYPDITIAQETFTGWQQDQGKQQINDIIAAGVHQRVGVLLPLGKESAQSLARLGDQVVESHLGVSLSVSVIGWRRATGLVCRSGLSEAAVTSEDMASTRDGVGRTGGLVVGCANGPRPATA